VLGTVVTESSLTTKASDVDGRLLSLATPDMKRM
jgi:hypothetical protein